MLVFGFWVSGFGYWVQTSEFTVSEFGFKFWFWFQFLVWVRGLMIYPLGVDSLMSIVWPPEKGSRTFKRLRETEIATFSMVCFGNSDVPPK